MCNKILNIAYFDDDDKSLEKVETTFRLVENITISFKGYKNHIELVQDIKNQIFNYEYLILDVYDKEKDENVAGDVLNAVKAYKGNTKVVLFSIGSTSKGAAPNIKYNQSDYPFLMNEHIIPKASIDELVKKIIDDYLENNTPIQFDYLDKDDILLKAEIISIGEKYISLIIRNIKNKKNIKSPILIERMSSGFSGASVFKLHINGKYSVLKVSKDKDKLDKEIKNAEEYYLKLPAPFRIRISDKEDYSINGIAAYLIENVPDGKILFDFLKENSNSDEIINFLEKLFIKGNCLKSFYSDNIVNEDKYYFINKKFDEIKYSKVKLALKELSPFISEDTSNSILDFIKDNKYKNIRPDGTSKKNKIVICHGDFHSRNIMISNGDPIIIDTGGMKEDYWCMDICRLITNLFIEGFDYKTKDYYDINKIENQIGIVKRIINLEKIELDDVNKGFIIAINWIIENIVNIYGDMFCKWEFQLGILKEFLQVSYRKSSIPPNKRAIAILSAHECLISANKLFK